MQEELNFKVDIGDRELIVSELTIDQSNKFLKWLLKAYRDIDFEKVSDPIILIEKAVDIATNNFPEFAESIFVGQDIKNIKWRQVKLSKAIQIINFFFKSNKESVNELQKLATSSASGEMIGEMTESVKNTESN